VTLDRFLATWNGLTLENRVNRIVILLSNSKFDPTPYLAGFGACAKPAADPPA
jgi:hypothetical protein